MAKIITPTVTIFNDYETPDYEGCKKVIDFLIEGGVDGILVLGSTGEFTVLHKDEKRRLFEFYRDYVGDRVELYAGTRCMPFKDTVELSNLATEMGYKGSLVIGPYYYAVDPESYFIYYNELAKNAKGDIYIYNFPARSGSSITPDLLKRLTEANDNIVGLKDSVPTFDHTASLFKVIDPNRFQLYSGFDDNYLLNIQNGGAGGIGGLSNIVPEIWSRMVRATNEGDKDTEARCYALIISLMPIYSMCTNSTFVMKQVLKHRGLDINTRCIFPFNEAPAEVVEKACRLTDEALERFKAIE
ncbi:MAG: dihydrodipicolinate synthase family protein [Firmicutes bacterium]|jgi:4-hydroxy-tetrahydrodipicolinate synthase|nr:dihydrodipicolinate synthase family protein [Bacillota bacterium]MBR6351689.1 dihydrodipicolinate synthase family protein [Bacillota bacterium]